jgi:glycosyltransferase involved in cell wall biosynthesis
MFLQSKNISLKSVPRGGEFDGVVCFGGCDWWYHNRGHYDLQMMRHFSADMPVLYVNSIGVRVPKLGEGAMFLHRITRKLKSIRRGLVKVSPNFGVVSPFVIPGKKGMAISRKLMAPQIRYFSRKMGIRKPLVWVNCVSAAEVVDSLNPAAVIYERTDRTEAFPESNKELILGYDARLKRRADVTLYCSRMMIAEESGACHHAEYVDHGVDYERFATVGEARDQGAANEPEDLKDIPHPRIGFVGGIDAHTFDPPLLIEAAKRLPQVHFVLVGSCSLPAGWCELPNVHLLGQRPYEQVANYMAACDVLIMPWNDSEWIQACNPVKLKEYLAVGRPIVSTGFAELKQYDGFVRVAKGADEFVSEISQALSERCDSTALRRRVQRETWRDKYGHVIGALQQQGITSLGGQCGNASY